MNDPASRRLAVAETVNDVPRIVVGPGATVEGELRFDHPVQLFVSDRATIGQFVGATATTFSGDSPPG
jgi:hypothetical protein